MAYEPVVSDPISLTLSLFQSSKLDPILNRVARGRRWCGWYIWVGCAEKLLSAVVEGGRGKSARVEDECARLSGRKMVAKLGCRCCV